MKDAKTIKPFALPRRAFMKAAATAGAFAALGTPAFGAQEYPYKTYEAAMQATGFDPKAPGAFTTVWTADIHYGHGDPETLFPPMTREINVLSPRPAFFCVAGDMICAASLCFGQVPGDKQKAKAIEEFKLFRAGLATVDSGIPTKLTLGNHDTYPGEGAPALFHTVFPDRPEFWSETLHGVHFVFLNGGSSGYIDPEQTAWFRDDVKKNHKPGATLVIVCHQPALGSVTAERGITAAVRAALDDVEGDLYFIAGHSHSNSERSYKLGKSVIHQLGITAGNPTGWGSENPGYWVYGFAGGKLVSRVFRFLGSDAGYRVVNTPPKTVPAALKLPFEGHGEILWKVMVGEGDEPYRVETSAAWCLNYWHYNKFLIYRFPLSKADGKAQRFALLATPSDKKPILLLTSPDGKEWAEVERVDKGGDSIMSFVIPDACRKSGQLYVRMESCVTSGFALTK